MKTMTKTLSAVAITIAAVLSAGAYAQDYSETTVTSPVEGLQSITVSHADLDMNTAEARETFYYRLSGAAHKVCGSSDFRRTGSVRQAAQNKSCYNTTMEQALSDVATTQIASSH